MSVAKKSKLLIVVGILLVLGGVPLALKFSPAQTIKQPIAFPHRVHVINNKIDCSFCHEFFEQQAVAGMPRTQICASCHKGIKNNTPEMKKIFEYYDRKEEIPWVRVYEMPDHVVFTHKRHIKAGLACSVCHGHMGESTKAVREVNLTMGLCIDCHKSRKVSVDCWTCHK